jgi:hypothetical protein
MHEEPDLTQVPTSPELPVRDTGLVQSAADFSGALTLDLTDDEIGKAFEICTSVKRKYEAIFRSKFRDTSFTLDEAMREVEKFEDEIKTRLAEEADVLATVNVLPVLEGKNIEIDWIGVLPSHSVNKYGMDHEKKEWEVKRATDRREDYLGQKGA